MTRTKSSSESSSINLGIYIVTFFASMVGFELILEKAMSEYNTMDSFASISTLFQFGLCAILPLLASCGKVMKSFPRTRSDLTKYIQLSIIVYSATFQATRSLKYVRYPTKVVFKSAKLIPTMIVSSLLNKGKKYSYIDYLSAFMLCVGTAGYTYSSSSKDSASSSASASASASSGVVQTDSSIGILLLIGSITCDALVPNLQQRLMSSSSSILPQSNKDLSEKSPSSTQATSGISAHGLMFNVNTIGFLCIILNMFVSGSLFPSISMCIQKPSLLLYLTSLGLCLAVAVLAYTKLIQSSGSVLAVTVATLRKVVTVVLSYIFFPKPLLRAHVFSGFLVLAGLSLNGFVKAKKKSSHNE